jgi:flagellar biosynthesis GTPase FlhF
MVGESRPPVHGVVQTDGGEQWDTGLGTSSVKCRSSKESYHLPSALTESHGKRTIAPYVVKNSSCLINMEGTVCLVWEKDFLDQTKKKKKEEEEEKKKKEEEKEKEKEKKKKEKEKEKKEKEKKEEEKKKKRRNKRRKKRRKKKKEEAENNTKTENFPIKSGVLLFVNNLHR